MRNLLALAALGIIVFLGLGWYLGWYQIKSTPTADGHNQIQFDVNTKKIKTDVTDEEEKVKNKVKNWLNEKNGTNPQSSTNNPAPNGATTSFSPNSEGAFVFPASSPTPPGGGQTLPTPR